jgi:hypothetical protein
MKSEALRNVRTMRQVKTSLDVLGKQKPRTTNSLSKTREEVERLESMADRQLEQVLTKEKARFAALDASVERSRQHVIKSREKLAATINKNRALTELRHELQQARWEGRDPAPPKAEPPAAEQGLRQIELKY